MPISLYASYGINPFDIANTYIKNSLYKNYFYTYYK